MPRSWSIKKMFKKSPDSSSKASSSNYDNGSTTTNSYHNTSFDDNSNNSSDLLKRRLVGSSGSTEEVFRTTQEEADQFAAAPFTRKLSYSSFTTAAADKASSSTTTTTSNRESWKSKSVNGLQLTTSSTSNLYNTDNNPEQPSVSSGVGTYVEKVITSLDNSAPTQQPTATTTATSAAAPAGLLKLDYVSLDFIRSEVQSCRAKSKEKLDISVVGVGLENGVSVDPHGSQSSVSSSFISSVGSDDDEGEAASTVGSEELDNLYAKMRRQTRVIVGSEGDDFQQQQQALTADEQQKFDCDSSSNNNNNNGNQLFASVKSAVGNALCSNKSAAAGAGGDGVEKQSTDDKCSRTAQDTSAQQHDPTSDRDVPDGEPSCSDSYQVIVDADYCSNNLTEFPTTLWQYSHTLKKLVLESNSIEILPNELFSCHQLEFLSVSDNDISEVPPALASLVNLNHLDLSKNVISNMPDSIRHCKNLRVLDMSVNPLERLADCFTQLINLTELFMIDCFFEFLPSSIGRMCNLRVLELRDNQLQNLPKSMRKLTQLERLDLGGNVFQDWPDVICHLENLAELWLDANDLCRISLDIGKLTKMIYLDLSHNLIDVVPSQIGKLTMLHDLVLSDNNISQLPDTIGFVSRLSTLNMATNQLCEVPASMGKLRQLTELDLQSNQLTIVPASIGNLQQLRTLLLDENELTEVPREIGNCKCLNVLQLSSNKITVLPDTVGNLNNLRVLNVCQNLLPHLPSSILKLNLNALWMSANQSKPDFPLELLYDQTTNKRFLTNCLFPQDQLQQRQYARKGASNIQEINARWLEDETQDDLIDMADDASPHNRQRGKTLVAFNLDISYNSECSVSPVETSESEDEGHYQTNAEYFDEVREGDASVVDEVHDTNHQIAAASSVATPCSILRHNRDIHDNGGDDDLSVFINDQNVKKSQNLQIYVATSPPSDGDDTTSIMTSPTASTVSKTTTTATSTPNNKEEVEIEVMTSSLYTVKPGIKQWSSYQNLLQLSSDHIPPTSNTKSPPPPPPNKDDKAKKTLFKPDILHQKAASSSTQAVVEVDKSPPCSSLFEFEPYNQVDPVPPVLATPPHHHHILPANNDLDSGVGNDVESQESLPDEHAIPYAPTQQRPPVPEKKATTDKNKVFKNINKFEKILATTEAPATTAVTTRLPPPIAPKPKPTVATNKPAMNDKKDTAQFVDDVVASKNQSFRDKLDQIMKLKPKTGVGLSNVASSKRVQRSYEKLRRITSPVPPSFNAGGGGHAFDNLTAESDQTTSPTSDHSVHMRIRQRLSNSSNGENELERSTSRNQQRLLYRNSKAMDHANHIKQVQEDQGNSKKCKTLEEQLGQLLLDGDETYKGHRVYDQQNGTTIHGTTLNLGGVGVEKAPTRDERPADWRNQLLEHIERKKAEKMHQQHDINIRHVRRYHSTTDELSPPTVKPTSRQRAASTRMLRTRTPGPEQSMDYINSMYNIDLLNRPKSAMGVVTSTHQLDYPTSAPTSSQEEKTPVTTSASDVRSYYHRNKQRSRSPVNHINHQLHRHSSGTTHKIAPPSYEDHMLRKASSRQQIDMNRVASVSPPTSTAGYFPLRSTGSHESVLHMNNEKQIYKPQQPHHHHHHDHINAGKEMKSMRASNSHDSLLDTSHLHHYYQPTTHHHIPYHHYQPPPQPQHKKIPPQTNDLYNGAGGGYLPTHHNTRLPPQMYYSPPTSYPSGGGYHDNYAYPNNMYHPAHHHRRAPPQQQRSGGGGNYSDLYNQQQIPQQVNQPPPPQRSYQQQQAAYTSSSNYHQNQPQKQQQQRKYNKEREEDSVTSAFRPYHETHPGEQQPTTAATSGYQPARSNRNQSVYQSKRYQQANNNKSTTQQSRRSVAMPAAVAVQPSHMSSEDQTTIDSESSWTTDYHANGGYPHHHHAIDASSSDNKIEIIRVTVRKNPTFGFHIMGGIDAGENPYRKDDNGVFITFVQPQGSADGQVRQGDKILMVNGSDFVGIKHKRAVDLLRNAGQTACLVLERIVPRSTSGRPV